MSAIPKSLHTVTALINVAKHVRARVTVEETPRWYVERAASILGHALDVDQHGLLDRAEAALAKEIESTRPVTYRAGSLPDVVRAAGL